MRVDRQPHKTAEVRTDTPPQSLPSMPVAREEVAPEAAPAVRHSLSRMSVLPQAQPVVSRIGWAAAPPAAPHNAPAFNRVARFVGETPALERPTIAHASRGAVQRVESKKEAQEADEYAAKHSGPVPTYDTAKETEGWDVAGGVDRGEGDKRRFKEADGSRARQRQVFIDLGRVNTVDDIDCLDPAIIRDINPQSVVLYRILHDVLHQSWHVAKEELLEKKGAPPNEGNRRLLMTKLWEYRQWHHQKILEEVQAELNARENDTEALKASKGAGSATLSSDIDVNLKGNHTELAVPLFNERFRNPKTLSGHTWDNEAGVVYDVNVYAVDFMHMFGGKANASGQKVTKKEGARVGQEMGGIGSAALAAEDRKAQLQTSLFKARLFMDDAQWKDYQALTLKGLPGADRGPQEAAFRGAEALFAGYLAEMAAEMNVKLDAVLDKETKKASGVERLAKGAASKVPRGEHGHEAAAKQENVLMTAANRIYERKLAVIHAARAELKATIAAKKGADDVATEKKIDAQLLKLRGMIAEAAMYANEASMTDATIHHGVVGIQGGAEINQTKAEGVNAVNEHLADVMKEANRYGPDLGHAAYKSGKYLMRLGDAAKNLGFGYIGGVQKLYKLGWTISVYIKGRAESEADVDTAEESAMAARAIADASDLPALLKLGMETAADVTREQTQERLAHSKVGEETDTAFGHATPASGALNAHTENQDMVHPIDRPKAPVPAQEADAPLHPAAVSLTPAETEKLQADAIAKAT